MSLGTFWRPSRLLDSSKILLVENRNLEGVMTIPLSQVPNLLATYVRSVGEWIFMPKANKDLSLFEHWRQRLVAHSHKFPTHWQRMCGALKNGFSC